MIFRPKWGILGKKQRCSVFSKWHNTKTKNSHILPPPRIRMSVFHILSVEKSFKRVGVFTFSKSNKTLLHSFKGLFYSEFSAFYPKRKYPVLFSQSTAVTGVDPLGLERKNSLPFYKLSYFTASTIHSPVFLPKSVRNYPHFPSNSAKVDPYFIFPPDSAQPNDSPAVFVNI